jgi:hypothetical protein
MRKITGTDVREVKAMNDRQLVFRLQFQDLTYMIVKVEWANWRVAPANVGPTINIASKLMQRVTPSMDVEVVGAAELAQLKLISPRAFKPIGERERMLGAAAEGGTVYKMPFYDSLRHAQAMTDKGKGRKLLGKLKGNADVLQMLGKIVAVDLFNGNTDRFGLNGEMANFTNIFFVKNNDKSYTPVGVDFVHLQVAAADLVAGPPPAERGPQNIEIQWGGPILMNEQTRAVYASKCIASLNNKFHGEMMGLGQGPVHPQELLLYSDQMEFTTGLRKGAKKLQKYLTQEAAAGRLPQGVLTRMELLRWPVPAPGPARPQTVTPQRTGFTSRGVFFENRPTS